MKLRTHAACGILLATLISPEVSFVLICWAVVWSVISDLDHYIPTVRHRGITHSLAFALFSGALVLAVGKIPPAVDAIQREKSAIPDSRGTHKIG